MDFSVLNISIHVKLQWCFKLNNYLAWKLKFALEF